MHKDTGRRDAVIGLHGMFVSTCNGWDMADDFNIQLYRAELKIDIGPYKAGTIVETVYFMFLCCDCPYITIYDNNSNERKFLLNFQLPTITEK